jgi:hypothetical protein
MSRLILVSLAVLALGATGCAARVAVQATAPAGTLVAAQDLPRYPGSTFERESRQGRSTEVAFTTGDGLAQITSFYRSQMLNRGYVLASSESRPNRMILVFARGGVQVTLEIIQAGQSGRFMLRVTH